MTFEGELNVHATCVHVIRFATPTILAVICVIAPELAALCPALIVVKAPLAARLWMPPPVVFHSELMKHCVSSPFPLHLTHRALVYEGGRWTLIWVVVLLETYPHAGSSVRFARGPK